VELLVARAAELAAVAQVIGSSGAVVVRSEPAAVMRIWQTNRLLHDTKLRLIEMDVDQIERKEATASERRRA
jgi:hypothetical protein